MTRFDNADRKRHTRRGLRFESLEHRRLLAVTDFRFATYNALNFGTNSADRQDEYQVVFDDLDADVIVMQEITSEVGADLLLAALNNGTGGQTYARANFVNGNDSDHALFYDTSTVDLISQSYIPTNLREFGEYTVNVSGEEFNIYSAHLKASSGSTNEQLRLNEVTILRDHLESLPTGTEFIVAGDMNIYGSSEPAYQHLVGIESNNDGRLEDLLPASLIGEWHNNAAFASVHSQSPRTTSFGGGATGGMDDRFDMIFGNFGINDGVGVDYVSNSYFVHGNDGLHFNQAITDGTNNSASPAVIQALHDASDHLPVVADFQVFTGAGGVTITESNGNTSVAEGGATDSYDIVLDSVPVDTVTVNVTPDNQVDLGNGVGVSVALTFTPATALIPQAITVAAVDDAVAEGTHSSLIQHTTSSTDPDYDNIFVGDLSVEIADNDSSASSVVLNEIYVNPPDADDSREYIELRSSAPNEALTDLWVLEIEGDGASAGVIDAVQNLGSLSTGSNGLLALGQNYTTSTPWTFDAGTNVADLTGTTMENGSLTFLLVEGFTGSNGTDLDTDNDGVLDITPWTSTVDSVGWTDGGSSDAVYSAASLVQSGVPDAASRFVDDSTASSAAAWFHGDVVGTGLAVDYSITASSANLPSGAIITPGDTNYSTGSTPAGITLVESGGSTDVVEGSGSDSYTLVLDSVPTSDVNIAVTPDAETDLGAGAGTSVVLTFTAANALTPQTVTVTAVDDSDDEGAHTGTITHSVSSSDTGYGGFSVTDVVAAVTDNDAPAGGADDFAIAESNSSGSVTGTYLDTHSSDDVREAISEELYSGNKRSRLQHTWDFDVTGGDAVIFHLEAFHNSTAEDFQFDYSTDGGSSWMSLLTLTATTEDSQMVTMPSGLSGSVVVRVVDSNRSRGESSADSVFIDQMYFESTSSTPTPGITFVESGGSTEVAEGGATDSYTIALDTLPTANVVVTVTPDSQIDLGAGDGVPVAITFTPANGLDAQTLVVIAVDDSDDESAHSGIISHSVASSDTDYDGLPLANVSVSISDNDSSGGTSLALGESTTDGSVTAGSFIVTHVSDDVREVITEELFGGNKRSRLSHQWSFDVVGGASTVFQAEAYHNSNAEDFEFEYSTNGGSSWTSLFTVTASTDTVYSASLGSISGSVLVRVTDTDRSRGENSADSLFVDELSFTSASAISNPAPNPWFADFANALADEGQIVSSTFLDTITQLNVVQLPPARPANPLTTIRRDVDRGKLIDSIFEDFERHYGLEASQLPIAINEL